MQTPEALKQFWIPELDNIQHFLGGMSGNALVGMGVLVALTTYWLASRHRAVKQRVDFSRQSVELPVGGLSTLIIFKDISSLSFHVKPHWKPLGNRVNSKKISSVEQRRWWILEALACVCVTLNAS